MEDKLNFSGLSEVADKIKGLVKRETTETSALTSVLDNFKDSFIDDFLERPDRFFEIFQTALFSEDG